jgi:hypothetical protein
MRSQYVSAPDAYINYFVEQAGGNAVFRGTKIQRGYGLGSIFSRLFRFAMPLFKRGAKHVGKAVGKTGASFLTDVVSGANPKESAKSHLKTMGKTLAGDAAGYVTDTLAQTDLPPENQSGGARFAWRPKRGLKRKRATKKNHSTSRSKRSKSDAFSSSVF